MPISDEKRYEFITEQLRYTNEKIIEAFGLFLKLGAAVFGGAAWVITAPGFSRAIEFRIGRLVPWLFFGIGVGCVALIWINLKSWWGYRVAEASLMGPQKILPPRFPSSCMSEIVLTALIVIAIAAVWVVNPFPS